MKLVASPAVPPPSDEAALVTGFKSGDSATYESLIRAYGGRLLQATRRILNNDDEAREAVHQAFISAFKARHQFGGEARLSTWLHRIAVNTALMKLRTRIRQREESIDDLVPRFLPNGSHADRFASWDEPVDVALARKETAAQVRAAIDSLPATYREVLLLRDLEGLSNQEAADLVGTTVNAVKIRLHRARMALRTLLAPTFEQEGPAA